MEVSGKTVIIRPTNSITATDSGILLPDHSALPNPAGVVVAAGPECEVQEGDCVIHYLNKAQRIDGMTKKHLVINGITHFQMLEPHLMANVSNEYLAKQIMAEKNPILIFGEDAHAIGIFIIVRIVPPEELTKSGIHLPNMEGHITRDDIVVAEIQSVGSRANDHLAKPVLQPGKKIMLPKAMSGGKVPMGPKEEISWRTNSRMAISIYSDGEWKPVGGTLFVEPELDLVASVGSAKGLAGGDMRISGFKKEGSNIIIPETASSELIPKVGKVIAVGDGWSPEYTKEMSKGIGFAQLEVGDRFILDFFNHEGKIIGGVVEWEAPVNGKAKKFYVVHPRHVAVILGTKEKANRVSTVLSKPAPWDYKV